ncbi:nuclear inhibitor of protein phosphatase 1 isoform X1 [Lycorma delicatula]
MKGDKLIQKLMLDEKKCYLFGRNPQMCDFCIDHQSCSRVHAAFVYHKQLHRAYLVDLGSTHGTFIGSMRIESHKPTQLPIDSVFHFGASTRNYIIRERPQTGPRPIIEELEKASEEAEGALLGLPETETELDNLTEFNTAHNRRISMLGIGEDGESGGSRPRKRRKRGVTFNEDEEIINPEDIDPSVGRFRNLIHTTVVPTKRQRVDGLIGVVSSQSDDKSNRLKHFHHPTTQLYSDLPGPEIQQSSGAPSTLLFSSALASRLGLALPNPAPDVEMAPPPPVVQPQELPADSGPSLPEPKKKKYAKEAWPGKKPMPALLV